MNSEMTCKYPFQFELKFQPIVALSKNDDNLGMVNDGLMPARGKERQCAAAKSSSFIENCKANWPLVRCDRQQNRSVKKKIVFHIKISRTSVM